jgi:hypothetical protein
VSDENADPESPTRICALQKCILHCSLFGACGLAAMTLN